MDQEIRVKPYVVWKRMPDGLINATVGHLPVGWTQPSDGVEVTFQEIDRFDSWDDAYNVVRSEQEAEDARRAEHVT